MIQSNTAENSLLDAIKNETTAEIYLSDTSVEQFIKDVQQLIKLHADRAAILQAIELLQKFI